jgi:DNA repair protein RadD
VIPTGGGKTSAIAQLCRDAVEHWNGRVLALAHVKELLEQSAQTLRMIASSLQRIKSSCTSSASRLVSVV